MFFSSSSSLFLIFLIFFIFFYFSLIAANLIWMEKFEQKHDELFFEKIWSISKKIQRWYIYGWNNVCNIYNISTIDYFFLFIYFITSFFEELFMLRKIIIIKKDYVRIKIHVSSRFPRPCSKSRDPAITLKKKDKGVCGCRIPLLSMNKS